MNELTSEQAAYLAGLIDGEGCIAYHLEMDKRVNKRYPCLNVNISNTNPELINWIKLVVGSGYVYHAKAYQNEKHKTRWSITWKSNNRKGVN
jgi:hypothetical protein